MGITTWVEIGMAAATLASALFVAFQACFTRQLVSTTTAAYLEGHILLSVVPYGGTGAINLRLENVGAGYVEEVTLSFPEGLMALGDDGLVSLSDAGMIPSQIGSMGPREKREWYLGFTGHPQWNELPKSVPYELSYYKGALPGERKWYRRKERRVHVKHKGMLHLDTYTGSLVRAYTGLEDLRVELQLLRKTIADKLPHA